MGVVAAGADEDRTDNDGIATRDMLLAYHLRDELLPIGVEVELDVCAGAGAGAGTRRAELFQLILCGRPKKKLNV